MAWVHLLNHASAGPPKHETNRKIQEKTLHPTLAVRACMAVGTIRSKKHHRSPKNKCTTLTGKCLRTNFCCSTTWKRTDNRVGHVFGYHPARQAGVVATFVSTCKAAPTDTHTARAPRTLTPASACLFHRPMGPHTRTCKPQNALNARFSVAMAKTYR